MRTSDQGGRFTIESEIDRYWNGIDEDLRNQAGGEAPWWRYDSDASQEDSVYAVGSEGGGRKWKKPVMVKYIAAHLRQGETFQNDRGFYNADFLRFVINIRDLLELFPDTELNIDSFLRDRTEFNGKLFRPTMLYLRGLVADRYTLVTLDAQEVKEEEQINDSQFDHADLPPGNQTLYARRP